MITIIYRRDVRVHCTHENPKPFLDSHLSYEPEAAAAAAAARKWETEDEKPLLAVFPVVAFTSQLSERKNHEEAMGKIGSWERTETSRDEQMNPLRCIYHRAATACPFESLRHQKVILPQYRNNV
jgi:hypothetical protein